MNPYRPYFRAFDDETDSSADNAPATPVGVHLDGYTIEFDQKVAVTPVEVVATNPAPVATPAPHGNSRY